MPETIANLSARWDLAGCTPTRGGTFNDLHARLDFFKRQFSEYLPCLGPDSFDYDSRLELWLDNTADESEKRAMLELAGEIYFFSRDDFLKLYQSALTGPVCKWIIQEMAFDISDPQLSQKLDSEVNDHTWFCSLTDSMPIADFYHANKLTGTQHRPDCRSLARFGDPARIAHYMQNRGWPAGKMALKRIVILEDFVGSGTQLNEIERCVQTAVGIENQSVLDFLGSLPNKPPILFVPLIICPPGLVLAQTIAARHNQIGVDPLVVMGSSDFVTPASTPAQQSFEALLFKLVTDTWDRVKGNKASAPRPYSAFGFKESGARVVLFSNTPANTFSLIHHKSNSWTPLFARAARVR